MYKAKIYFDATEDNYQDGEIGGIVNSWDQELTAKTKEELKRKIIDATYQKDWSTFDDDQMNEYDHAYEYHTSYLANEQNEGDASESEIESWRKGDTRLWAINCQILVTEVTETKVAL